MLADQYPICNANRLLYHLLIVPRRKGTMAFRARRRPGDLIRKSTGIFCRGQRSFLDQPGHLRATTHLILTKEPLRRALWGALAARHPCLGGSCQFPDLRHLLQQPTGSNFFLGVREDSADNAAASEKNPRSFAHHHGFTTTSNDNLFSTSPPISPDDRTPPSNLAYPCSGSFLTVPASVASPAVLKVV